ncbi:UDP-GlcNAc:betaGal beta-1,3-N-acetylglucosaminyltransferase-like protein 1 [Papilio machaon]|uniref:UDP-GlcNAc:betaGal beta-1,3-N-acetylglucosaminyltransferase-like protein 1 n=1 Tax=Papilio machaon TaxID=76193 RepID=A0A0N1I9A8_PAPMA|nr:UDP-GlcNAc:betaGal beta-1,3-N-acetylglucosaminyltransferase-like protein 1 [Papilio machaon]
MTIDISIIIPVHNGEKWINSCMKSIANQTIFWTLTKVEIVVFNDGSNDNTEELLQRWVQYFKGREINFLITGSKDPKGVGAAKNGAVRSVYDNVGGFVETGHGTPEDLIFFYAHIDRGGELHRVDKELVNYTYHKCSTTFSISRKAIQLIQVHRLEKIVLSQWKQFTVWNAGKSGRKFVRSLTPNSQKKVVGFCDVDKKKIGSVIELYCPKQRKVIIKLPVVHFTEAKLPIIICMKLDLTNGEFERNLQSLNLIEGKDYYLFG